MQSARRRPVLIAGAAVAVVAVLVATTVFGGRLPWNAASIPLVDTPMQGPTVIDVATDDSSLSVAPGKGGRLDSEEAAMVIPPGAVASATTVSARVLQAPFHMSLGPPPQDGGAYASVVGPAVDFGPTGTAFNEPVTVSVPYDKQFLPAGASEDSVVPAYWNGQSWMVLPGVVDKDAHTVSVKLEDFKGVALLAVALGAAIVAVYGYTANYVYQNWGELTWSDPVTKGTASGYVTPTSPTVQKFASEAVITDKTQQPNDHKALNDPKMGAWLAAGNAAGHQMQLEYLDPSSGQALSTNYSKGAGTNWQTPDAFFAGADKPGGLAGDCTDETNSSVSVLIASGFRAKGVFGYASDDHKQHAWTEVVIDGQLYQMDEGGALYTPDNWKKHFPHTYNPPSDSGDRHYLSMWDNDGQVPYDKDWWKKNTLPTASPSAAPTPPAGAGGGVSDTLVYGSHTLTYTVTGVTTGPGDTPAHRKGTVTAGATVTVSGSVSYDGRGSTTNLSMSASLSASGGESKSASWPPEGVNGRPSDQIVNFPFSFQITIPPSPKPGATVSFGVSSRNCNDSGVCGGPSVDGDFLVVPGP